MTRGERSECEGWWLLPTWTNRTIEQTGQLGWRWSRDTGQLKLEQDSTRAMNTMGSAAGMLGSKAMSATAAALRPRVVRGSRNDIVLYATRGCGADVRMSEAVVSSGSLRMCKSRVLGASSVPEEQQRSVNAPRGMSAKLGLRWWWWVTGR